MALNWFHDLLIKGSEIATIWGLPCEAMMVGDLATLLVFAGENEKGNKKPGSLGKPGRTKWLVAGARNCLNLLLSAEVALP